MRLLRRQFLKLSCFLSFLAFTGFTNYKIFKKKKYIWYLNKTDK